jgi:hypothetical protein
MLSCINDNASTFDHIVVLPHQPNAGKHKRCAEYAIQCRKKHSIIARVAKIEKHGSHRKNEDPQTNHDDTKSALFQVKKGLLIVQ